MKKVLLSILGLTIAFNSFLGVAQPTSCALAGGAPTPVAPVSVIFANNFNANDLVITSYSSQGSLNTIQVIVSQLMPDNSSLIVGLSDNGAFDFTTANAGAALAYGDYQFSVFTYNQVELNALAAQLNPLLPLLGYPTIPINGNGNVSLASLFSILDLIFPGLTIEDVEYAICSFLPTLGASLQYGLSDPYTVTWQADAGTVPTAQNVTASTLVDTPVSACFTIQNEPTGEPLTITATNPANGTVTIDNNGCFIYTPTGTFTGTDVFTVQICDAAGQCNTATATITVNPNTPPDLLCDEQWTQYTNGQYINAIAIEGNFIWIGTDDAGLVKLNKTTGEKQFYNNANSGLPDNRINTITIDASGNKWIGTYDGGLAKFDDTTWTTYNTSNSGLPDDDVRAIAIDASGNKWIGTYGGGLAKFDDTTWTTYNTANSGLPNNDVSAIAIDATGNKWIGTNYGLSRFKTTWTNYNESSSGLPHNNVHAIAIDASGNKWIGTYGGLAKFDGTWTISNTANLDLPSNGVLAITIDANDNKWIGTGGGLTRFDGTTWTTYNTSNSELPNNSVHAIAIDTTGNKWIGTYRGLAKFDGSTWTTYNTSNSGLPDNDAYAIAIDASGNKWIGTHGGGVAKFDGTTWTTYNTSNSGLPNNTVNTITIDASGNKWIGTNGGLAKFDDTTWTTYNTTNSGLPINYVYTIAIDADGNKWIGAGAWGVSGPTSVGLAKFDGTTWTTYSNSNLPYNSIILAIAIDASGNKWIGTSGGGLAKFDGTNWTTYNTSNSGLPDNDAYAIAIDASGNKWIGTYGGGLAKFDDGTWTTYNTSNSGLPYNNVQAITIDASGNKWIGINGGVAKFDGTTWTTYNPSNSGLPYTDVRAIAIDTNGNKWIGTNGGIGVLYSTVFVANISPSSTVSICSGQSVQLTASGGTSYQWSNGLGNSATVSLSPNALTTYTVTVTNSSGCTATASKVVTVNPTPTISAATPSCVGGLGRITVTASGGSSLTYKLGNGTPQTSNVFNNLANGTYTITVSNSNGCTTTANVTVSCTTCPTATASNNGPKCAGNNITLSTQPNLPAGITATYNWSGGLSSNATATVNTSGTYTVTVTYSNGCISTASTVAIINPLPSANISPSNPTICSGLSVQLTASGGTSYQWSNGLGTSATVNPSPTTNTTYTVTVTNANGCTATASKSVTVNPTPSISAATPSCVGGLGRITVTASGGSSLTYILGNGAPQTSNVFNNLANGTYTITVSNSNGCTTTANVTVSCTTCPTATASNNGPKCAGNNITLSTQPNLPAGITATYNWSGGLSSNATASVNTSGTYTVTVTYSNGCSSTASTVAIINALPSATVTPSGVSTICNGQTVSVTAGGGTSYQWSNSLGTSATVNPSPTNSTTYTVTVTNANGCTATASKVVTVNPLPSANISPSNPTICSGQSVQLTASGGTSYQWSNSLGASATVNLSPNILTTYTVTVTNASGCTATASKVVTVNPTPSPPTLASDSYCQGVTATALNADDTNITGETFAWNIGGAAFSSITPSTATVGSVTYTVTVTKSGCSTTRSATITVSIPPTQYNITGGGSYCAGSGGVAVGLSDSEVGVTYQLQLNGNNVGTLISGNNNAIEFGNQNNAGTYTVIANNNGCTLAMDGTASVVINSTPTAVISPSGAISICSGQSTQLTASGGTSYQWSNGLGTSATINPTLSSSTTYTVTVTGANDCTATATKNVTVNTLPTAAISASGATTFCQGSSVNLTATGGNSYVWSSGSNATGITASTAGVYTVTVSNANNCTASVSTSVTVNPLPTTPIISYNGAVAAANISACDEAALSIATTNGISYQWKKNNNATAVTSAIYNTSSSGIFTVQATNNATGCQSVSNGVNLTIYALPPALLTAEGSTALCPQDSLKLKASPTGSSYTYLWSDGATGSNNWVSDAGTYTVTVTHNYGAISCSAVADAITLTQRPAPTAKATYITQNNTATFTNQSTEAVSYIWDFGDDTPLITETNPIHTYLSEGYFTVQLTAINTDGCETTSSFGVLIMPLAGNTQSVLFPNPNNGNFTLNLQLAKASVVVVDVFDVTGRLIKRFESTQTVGLASLNFAMPQLSSGIYLLGVYIDDTTSNYTDFEHGLLANKPLKYNHYRKLLVVD